MPSPRVATHILGLPRSGALAYALVLTLAFVFYTLAWRQAPLLDGDSAQYMEVARDLKDGDLDALHVRTPGYPLILLLTGSADAPARELFWLSLALHLASIWLLGAAFHRAGATQAWLVLLCVLLALPPYVEPAAYVMTENLAQATLVAGFACLVFWHGSGRVWWVLVAGLAFASSALVRPVYQLLSPAIALTMIVFAGAVPRAAPFRRRSLTGALGLVLVWAAVLGGAATVNNVRHGWFGISPASGLHFTTKTTPLLERAPDECAAVREILIRARDAELTKPGGTHTGTQAVWHVRDELQEATGLDLPGLSQYLLRMNVALIRRAPLEYLQEVARSAATYWFPAAGRLASMDSTALRWSWTALHGTLVIAFLIVMATLLSGGALALSLPASIRKSVTSRLAISQAQSFAFTMATAIVFYTMVLSCAVDIGEPRQRRSTDALFVFASMLGVFVWRRAVGPGAPQAPGELIAWTDPSKIGAARQPAQAPEQRQP